MNADTDLLDLGEFTRMFEAGELTHLTKKTKPKPIKKVKSVVRLADPTPSSIVPLVERITCKGCGESVEFLKSYGLKTIHKKHTNITAVTEVNIKQFNKLVEQDLFDEPLISEQTFQNCCKCVKHKWQVNND